MLLLLLVFIIIDKNSILINSIILFSTLFIYFFLVNYYLKVSASYVNEFVVFFVNKSWVICEVLGRERFVDYSYFLNLRSQQVFSCGTLSTTESFKSFYYSSNICYVDVFHFGSYKDCFNFFVFLKKLVLLFYLFLIISIFFKEEFSFLFFLYPVIYLLFLKFHVFDINIFFFYIFYFFNFKYFIFLTITIAVCSIYIYWLIIYNSLDFFFGKRLDSYSAYDKDSGYFRSRFFFNLYKYSLVIILLIIILLLSVSFLMHIFNIYHISVYSKFLDYFIQKFDLSITDFTDNEIPKKFKDIVIEHLVTRIVFLLTVFFNIPLLLFVLLYIKLFFLYFRFSIRSPLLFTTYFFLKIYRKFDIWVYDILFMYVYFTFFFLLLCLKYKVSFLLYVYFINIYIIILLLLILLRSNF